MNARMYINMHFFRHVYMHEASVCKHLRMHISVHARTNAHTHVNVLRYTLMHASTHVSTYTHPQARKHANAQNSMHTTRAPALALAYNHARAHNACIKARKQARMQASKLSHKHANAQTPMGTARAPALAHNHAQAHTQAPPRADITNNVKIIVKVLRPRLFIFIEEVTAIKARRT